MLPSTARSSRDSTVQHGPVALGVDRRLASLPIGDIWPLAAMAVTADSAAQHHTRAPHLHLAFAEANALAQGLPVLLRREGIDCKVHGGISIV